MSVSVLFPQSLQAIAHVTHPDYSKMAPEWVRIRDAVAGSEQIKDKGVDYLPPFADAKINATGYEEYLSRAVFVPFSGKLVNGMIGAVFRHPVKVTTNLSEKIFDEDLMSPAHINFQAFAKSISREMFTVGRVGVLVDYSNIAKRATTHIFRAENILSWEEDIDGNLIYLLLRENKLNIRRISDATTQQGTTAFGASSTSIPTSTYLSYTMEGGKCVARKYDQAFAETSSTIIMAKGSPLNRIPFTFFNPQDNRAEIRKSPIVDVVNMNITHYQNYGLLQLGRKHTAFPIYVVPVEAQQDDVAHYTLNPSVVWEVPMGSKPMVLEYFGQGLNNLSESLTQIESQIVQVSARLVGLRDLTSKYEDKEIFKILFQAELATLIDMTQSVANGLTRVMNDYLELNGVPGNKESWDAEAEVSQEFRVSNIEARELRAISLLHEDGLLPLTESYRILQANDFISTETSYEEYKSLVSREKAVRKADNLEEIALKKGLPAPGVNATKDPSELDPEDSRTSDSNDSNDDNNDSKVNDSKVNDSNDDKTSAPAPKRKRTAPRVKPNSKRR